MCCGCFSTKIREGTNWEPSHERVIHSAFLTNNPESCLQEIISISLETFKDATLYNIEHTSLFNRLVNPQNGKESNILLIEDSEDSQEILTFTADQMLNDPTGPLTRIPIIYFVKDPSYQSFISRELLPPTNVCLGAVGKMSKIFQEHFPLSERQEPTTCFYPAL